MQYILTHPGTPCVFYDHMFHEQHLGQVIRRLISIRKDCGIHCRSEITILHASHDLYAAEIDEKLVVKLGPGDFCPSADDYHIADRGNAWAIWKKK
jgi:alpha-amylase